MTKASHHNKILRPEDWEKLPEQELCKLRVRDLGLQIATSPLAPCIERLYAELDACGIQFHPPCYLANEWLCPDKVPMIGIPFYLAHRRLKQLQKKIMLEVEGGSEASCMKILRHEAGHAINYAYRLYRRTRWRELFGAFSAPYRESYYAYPYSRRYVIHLEDNYAQAHPDDDFAETFAVCITPDNKWRHRYKGWPAMKKLLYVESLIRDIGTKPPVVTVREELRPATRMTSTLAGYYDRMRRYLGEDFPGFYDPALEKLFTHHRKRRTQQTASIFLHKWRRHIIDSVCAWTGDRKYDVNALIRLLIRRCQALKLYVDNSEAKTLSEFVAFVTAAMNKIHRFLEPRERT